MATARSRVAQTLWWTILALPGLMGLSLCPVLLRAQDVHSTTETDWRLDFEDDVNRDSVPDAWRLISGRLNRLDPKGKLVTENPHSGKTCFGIRPDGTAATYETIEACPLDGRFTYSLSGWVRTVDLPVLGLRRTLVRMEAVILDNAEKVLETLAGEALTGTHETWHRLVVEIPPAADAMPRKVRIRLVIDGSALTGRVWFDDVRLVAQPTINVSFSRPSRLLTPADDKTFQINLATLTEPEYTLEMVAVAPDGSKVLERSVTVTPDVRRRASVKAELPVRLFGMYELHVGLKSAGVEKAVRDIRLGYLPSRDRRNGPAGRFGVVLSGSVEDMQAVAPALGDIGLGHVLLKLWHTDETTEGLVASTKRLDPLLARLRGDHIEPVLVLSGVPQEVGVKLLDDAVVPDWSHLTTTRLLMSDPKYWLKPLRATAEALGRRSGCWLLGEEPDLRLKPEDPARIRKAFLAKTLGLAPRWKLGLPVGLDQDRAVIRAAHRMDFVILKLGDEVPTWKLGKLLADLRGGPAEQWLNVRLPLEHEADRNVQHAGMVQRAASGLAAGAQRIIVEPASGDLVDEQQNLRDWLLVLGTLVRELDGLDYVGDLSVEPTVHALTFSGSGRTTTVFWTDKRVATWSGDLGASAKRTDLRGNTTSVADAEGVVRLDLAELPFLVTGIDSERIRTQLSVNTSPGVPDSTTADQTVELSFVNRFRTQLAGKLSLRAPEGWRVTPTEFAFDLRPGESASQKLSVQVPINETIGVKPLPVTLTLKGDPPRSFKFVHGLELGSTLFDAYVSLIETPGADREALVRITNLAERPVSLSCSLSFAKTPVQKVIINDLAPGVCERHSFTWNRPVSREWSLKLRELDGPGFYNRRNRPLRILF